MERGIHPTPKLDETQCLLAFKQDHMQLIEPILCWKIFNFYTFRLGGQFLLPKGPIMERGIHPTLKLNETEGF